MWLRKHEVGGGCSVGPHTWENDGDVVEVPDDLGNDLLRLGGYEQAEAPKTDSDGGEDEEKPRPRRRAANRPDGDKDQGADD